MDSAIDRTLQYNIINNTLNNNTDLSESNLSLLLDKIYDIVSISIEDNVTKDYIKENGFPKTTNDLDYHKIISYGEDAQPPIDRHRLNWLLTIGKDNKRPRKPILEVSSIYGIAKATEVGMGIASLPDWMEFEMIELTEILSQLEGPKMSISLCFNYELRNDSRIKAFKDFMLKEAEVIN